MVNRILTYRNRINGEIGVYPEELARHFENLEEVDPDAKPLAYVPIEQEAIEQFRGQSDEAIANRASLIGEPGDEDEDSETDKEPESGEEGKK